MDNQKLRAELQSLANWATVRHEEAARAEALRLERDKMMHQGEVRGILKSVAEIGLLFDPPLEVVSEGPRYVVRVKKAKDAAAVYQKYSANGDGALSRHGAYRQIQREQQEKAESKKALLLGYSLWFQKLLWLPEEPTQAKLEWLIELFQKERSK